MSKECWSTNSEGGLHSLHDDALNWQKTAVTASLTALIWLINYADMPDRDKDTQNCE